MNLTPITNGIIFKFLDAVNSRGEFEKSSTAAGIILKSSVDDSAKDPRWVEIVAVGPDCTVKPGQQLLLPNLRWTSGFKHNGQRMWKTDQVQAAAVRNTPDSEVEPLASFVIFTPIRKAEITSTISGLVVVGGVSETAKGTVVSVGPEASPEVLATTIYYDDTNFSDTFKHNGVTMSFIKDENILAYA